MITHQQLDDYCLSKPGTTTDFPFDPTTRVYRVLGKIFALTDIEEIDPISVNLKCDPDWALILRDHYAAVTAGYHMNKRHWNTVRCDDTIPDAEIWEMVDHSYLQVLKGLTKAQRESLLGLRDDEA
jgi:predicted DNA-binding protein (MmcQ/YjbR family)